MLHILLDTGFVWKCAWQSTFCLGLGIGASFLFSSRPARAHRVLVLALVAALVTPLLSQTVHHFGWGVLRSRSILVPPPSRVTEMAVSPELADAGVTETAPVPQESPQIRESVPVSRTPQQSLSFCWRDYLFSMWILLSVLVSIRLTRIFIRENRIRRFAQPCENPFWLGIVEKAAAELRLDTIPRIVESQQIHCPAMWCWGRRATLLLPQSTDTKQPSEEWSGIILHELAHWKRRDHIAQLLGEFFVCIFPWNLFGWWTRRRLGHLSERSCDDWALANGNSPESYVRSLLALVPQRRPAFALATVTSRRRLQQRIGHILKSKRNDPAPGRFWTSEAVAVVMCVSALIALAQVRPSLTLPLRGLSGEIILGLGTLAEAAYSPDGRYIATCGGLGAFLWDVETGEVVRWFSGHSRAVTSIAFSPDGSHMLTVSRDSTAKVWDVEMGGEIRTFSGHTGDVRSAVFSPDGSRVLTGSLDRTAKLWDVETGGEVQTFSGHTREVYSVAFSPDGSCVLTGSSDRMALLWDTATGEELRAFLGHSGPVESVAFSPDGTQVLTGGRAYDFVTETEFYAAKMWDVETEEEIRTFRGHTDPVSSVAFSPEGNRVLTASWDNTAKLWDVETGEDVWTFRCGGSTDYMPSSAAFSPDGKYVLTASTDGIAKLWDVETGEEIRTLSGHADVIRSVAYSPDGKRVLAGGAGATLWDVETSAVMRTFSGHMRDVTSVAFSPDGHRVLTASRDNTAKLWDVETGEEIRTFSGNEGLIESVAFSPDGNRVLTGSRDPTGRNEGTAKLWDVETGEVIRTFSHGISIYCVAFSPDGNRLLTGGTESDSVRGTRFHTAKLWDVETGTEIHTFPGAGPSVAFSPDGTQILIGSTYPRPFTPKGEDAAKLWDVQSGRQIRTFRDTSLAESVAFSPDGRHVLTAGIAYDLDTDTQFNAATIWDVETGEKIRRLYAGPYIVFRLPVAFSPDGRHVLTGGSDSTARIWDISDLVAGGMSIRDWGLY